MILGPETDISRYAGLSLGRISITAAMVVPIVLRDELVGVLNIPTANTTPSTPGTPNVPPLTRAATRLRIEEMSPVRWLANYGIVSIGQRE